MGKRVFGWSVPASASTDWKAVRETINLAEVATRLLGPAPGRRGERGRKLWWPCPLHEDANPSFCVTPGSAWWKCFGCGQSGDAASLVMKTQGLSFPEAVRYLESGCVLAGSKAAPIAKTPSTKQTPEPKPSALDPDGAAQLVACAADRLWEDGSRVALAYLTGPLRGLTTETIRAARLGYAPTLNLPGGPSGIVVPWFNGDALTLLKLRQPAGRKPKYYESFRDRQRHTGIYPGPHVIRPGKPLVIVEGEFDALLLGQELGDLAPVITLGSASARPEGPILRELLKAWPWFIATDNDAAGDKSAEGWPAPAKRVRPPGTLKDWTEARAFGVNLRRWWGEVLAGVERPQLFDWTELSTWRWGPAVGDPEPGFDIKRPDRKPTET